METALGPGHGGGRRVPSPPCYTVIGFFLLILY